MKKVIFYQLLVLAFVTYLWVLMVTDSLPSWILQNQLAVNSIFVAVIGSVLYCIRGVYINKCVKKNWDEDWEIWYYLRPIASALSGLAAFIFLKAGLVILDAEFTPDSSNYGFLAFSFIAGLNVDKFVSKIEDIAQSAFGIEKSRVAKESTKN